MPTIKLEEIVKSPKTLTERPVGRKLKEKQIQLESVRRSILHSSKKKKVDWDRLRGMRFDF